MAKLNLTIPEGALLVTGKQITFVSPCDSAGLTHVTIGDSEFELVDSNGNSLIEGAFATGATVSFILNVEDGKAYIQNADINYQVKCLIENKANNSRIIEDTETYFVKGVPENSGSYAKINKICGISKKSTNLLQGYEVSEDTNTKNLSFNIVSQIVADTSTSPTVMCNLLNASGSTISTVYGDALSQEGLYSVTFTKTLSCTTLRFGINGEELSSLVSIDVSNLRSENTYTISANFTNITQGTIIWEGMRINEGEECLPYESYSKGFISAPVTHIESVGGNLVAFPYAFESGTEVGDVTFKIEDRAIKISGVSDKPIVQLLSKFHLNKGTYWVSSCGTTSIRICRVYRDGYLETVFTKTIKHEPEAFNIEESGQYALVFYGIESTNTRTFTPVILKTEMEPNVNYGGDFFIEHSFLIPEDVQTLEDYGEGINEFVCNSVEWSNGSIIYNHRVKKEDISTFSWSVGTNRASAVVNFPQSSPSAISYIPPKFTNMYVGPSILTAEFEEGSFSTKEEFLEYISGIEFIYPLKEEEFIEVSSLSEDTFPVETDGVVALVNPNNCAFPNSIVFYEENNEVIGSKQFIGNLKGTSSFSERAIRDNNGKVIHTTYAPLPIISIVDITSGVTPLAEGQSYHVYE